jgi:Protein of unknown function (DUF3168)
VISLIETALWPLQKVLFQRWSNDTDLMQKITGVFDHVPTDQTFPYITIGEPLVTPNETKTSYWEEIPWTHHVWSQYSGKKEAYDIMSLMLKSLSSQPLSLEGGFFLLRFKPEQLQVITDIDNRTYHGILRIRYHIHK